MSVLEEYFRELRDIRSSGAGVAETSYYTPLSNLLNEVGKSLKPRVRCILQLANKGAGHPDGGLFTSEQVRHSDNSKPLLGQSPSRGVIEVKPKSCIPASRASTCLSINRVVASAKFTLPTSKGHTSYSDLYYYSSRDHKVELINATWLGGIPPSFR